jgi:O-antigen ligase
VHNAALFRAPPLVAVAVTGFASLCVAWMIAHGHMGAAIGIALLLPVGAFVLRRPENGLLLGVGMILVLPYWATMGASQASVARTAALLSLAGLSVVAIRPARARVRLTYVDAAVACFAAAACLSWIAGSHTPNSLQATFNAILPLSFYAAARLFGRAAAVSMVWVLVVAGTLASFTVFYELIVTHRPLFIDQDSYLWNAGARLIFRPGGVFGSPPAAATVLSMTTLCGLSLLSRSSGFSRRIVWMCLGLGTAGVVVTFTRAGIIGLGLGAAVYLALLRPASFGRVAFVAATAAFTLVLVVLPRVENTNWFQQGVLRHGDLAVRQTYWTQAWPLITNSPTHLAVGHGINSLLVGRPGTPGQPQSDLAGVPFLLAIGPHNQYVRTLLEEGLVGLILLLGWLVGSLARARGAIRCTAPVNRPLLAAFAAATASFMVVELAGDAMRNPPSVALVALLTGMIATIADDASAAVS